MSKIIDLNYEVYKKEESRWREYEAAIAKPVRPSEFVRDYEYSNDWQPSSRWEHGGPIIEREKIQIEPTYYGDWVATDNETRRYSRGDTVLEAAMRCYVGLFWQAAQQAVAADAG